jgi:hypothetical protein
MYEIRVTAEHLAELRMLADWQLRERGIDPVSVTAAAMRLADDDEVERDAARPWPVKY